MFPSFSLATGQALLASCGPGYVTTEAWGTIYSEGTVIIYSCKFMAEHHEIVRKFWLHFEPVDFKNLENKILF